MVIVQRIVTRWSKQERGAVEATLRSQVPLAIELPPMPDAPLVVHDLLAEARTGYEPVGDVIVHAPPVQLRGLRFTLAGSAIQVTRASTYAAYPAGHYPGEMFLLVPGDRARYRANFRFSGYSTEWYYEQWTVNIAYVPWQRDLFLVGDFDQDKDERVSLYGGRR